MNKPSASFLSAKNARDALTPVDSVSAAEFDLCQTNPRDHVGQRTMPGGHEGADSDTGLTVDELEQRIAEVGDQFVEAAEKWERDGCFAALGEASRLWSIQKHLIGLRSKEWVRKVEIERGLV